MSEGVQLLRPRVGRRRRTVLQDRDGGGQGRRRVLHAGQAVRPDGVRVDGAGHGGDARRTQEVRRGREVGGRLSVRRAGQGRADSAVRVRRHVQRDQRVPAEPQLQQGPVGHVRAVDRNGREVARPHRVLRQAGLRRGRRPEADEDRVSHLFAPRKQATPIDRH